MMLKDVSLFFFIVSIICFGIATYLKHRKDQQELKDIYAGYERVNIDLMHTREYFERQKVDLTHDYNKKLHDLIVAQGDKYLEQRIVIPDTYQLSQMELGLGKVPHQLSDQELIYRIKELSYQSSGTAYYPEPLQELNETEKKLVDHCLYCHSKIKADYEICPKCGAPL